MSTPRTCPVLGCAVQIPANKLICPEHWNMLPKPMRSEVWRWYRPGQEKSGMPSPMYLEAARAAIAKVNELDAVQQDEARQKILL